MKIQSMIDEVILLGYSMQDARAKVCQDIILQAIASSALSRTVTIKGGVVMREITHNIRRSTQDIDIDFIRYSLSDESIDNFINTINCLPDISIKRIGEIIELNQQDYHGKSIKIVISDNNGTLLQSKIDFGVHRYLKIDQEEYCFDISNSVEGASLLINSIEQMFTEKLKSLLKFGTFSTRYKDIYDMYYCCNKLNIDKLKACIYTYIYLDSKMRENNIHAIINRVTKIFNNQEYKIRVDNSDKRWLDEPIDNIVTTILLFLNKLA